MNELLARTYFNNTVQDYLIALGLILVGFMVIGIFRRFILTRIIHWTRRTTTNLDDFIITSINRFGVPALYVTAVYIGLDYLKLSARQNIISRNVLTVSVTFLIIRLISSAILLMLRSYVRHQDNGEEKVKQLGGVMLIINIIVWGIGLLFLFDNMGFDITAIIAGLGIGGIAIALAAQNILGDLFNYFVIFFDRPIETGDFIVVDDKNGVVDYIGIKTTRVKTLSGEQLVFSNSDLMKSRIHNFKRMEQRRILFKIGVTYQTSLENIKRIPDLIKAIIEEQNPVKFDRAHFQAYGDSSLNFEIVYYVLQPDYNLYMDIQQAINLRIYEEFARIGVEFAYPTRTLFMMNQALGAKKEPASNPIITDSSQVD